MNSSSFFQKKIFHNSVLQYIIIILSFGYVVVFLSWEMNRLPSMDHKVELEKLDAVSRARASQIEVGMHINNFQGFSVQKNEFTLDGTIWFKFPIGQESLADIEDFTIKNSLLVGGKTIFKSPPVVKIMGADVVVSYGIIAVFKTPLNHYNFPMSGHTINILVQHKNFDFHEMAYIVKPENFTLGNDLPYLLDEWNPTNMWVSSGYRNVVMQAGSDADALTLRVPTAMFSLFFEHKGYRDLASMYFPMLVIFLVSLFSLLSEVTSERRLGYAASAVPTLALFRLVITGASPSVGYTTHVDYIYYVLVFLSMLILVFQIYVLFSLETIKKATHEVAEKITKELYWKNEAAIYSIMLLLVVLTTLSYFR